MFAKKTSITLTWGNRLWSERVSGRWWIRMSTFPLLPPPLIRELSSSSQGRWWILRQLDAVVQRKNSAIRSSLRIEQALMFGDLRLQPRCGKFRSQQSRKNPPDLLGGTTGPIVLWSTKYQVFVAYLLFTVSNDYNLL